MSLIDFSPRDRDVPRSGSLFAGHDHVSANTVFRRLVGFVLKVTSPLRCIDIIMSIAL